MFKTADAMLDSKAVPVFIATLQQLLLLKVFVVILRI